MEFFRQQVVFLTGSTGGLGGCLLYKLSVTLQAPKIFVLIRQAPEQAIRRWATTMPLQVGEMLNKGNIYFVHGDATRAHYGLDSETIGRLEKEVTVIINAAARIHLKAPLHRAVRDNCLSALELGHLATKFTRLVAFVQISSAYALSDLPDGTMEERVYPIDDAERVLEDVLSGKSSDWSGFAWPYAKSKRIMECLLTERYQTRLPLLIVRPTGLGPAISSPCEMYGPIESCPVSNFLSTMMLPAREPAVFPATKGSDSGTGIFDELPIDLGANIILQHVQRGTLGVVHISSQSYVPKSFDDFLEDLDLHVPSYWRPRMARAVFSTDPKAQLCKAARFFSICSRNWFVRADRSSSLDVGGPIGVGLSNHDIDDFTRQRILNLYGVTMKAIAEKENRRMREETLVAKL